MKKIFIALILIVLLLTSCESWNEGSRGGVNNEIANSSSSHTNSGVVEHEEIEIGEQQEKLLIELQDNYLPLYGIMINNEDWDSAEKIPVIMYYAWYRDYINSITTIEEREERYKLDTEKYNYGWAYPSAEFESFVQKYFDVSQEYLRSSDIYQPEEDVYWIPGGGGGNIRDRVRMENQTDLKIIDNMLIVKLACSFSGDFSDTIYRELTLDMSGDIYKYIKCITL